MDHVSLSESFIVHIKDCMRQKEMVLKGDLPVSRVHIGSGASTFQSEPCEKLNRQTTANILERGLGKMPESSYRDWDEVYRDYPAEALPWELGKPRKNLTDLVENGRIQPGSSLDLCCGLGTNTVYMAQSGFDVTAIDISKHALELAKQKARKARAEIKFVLASFVTLPFKDAAFDFVFDMGCFHHVEVEDRPEFIQGVKRILKQKSNYLLICFSDRNGRAWNHFTKEQIAEHFSGTFKLKDLDHFGSVEGDGYTRFFYSALMQPR